MWSWGEEGREEVAYRCKVNVVAADGLRPTWRLKKHCDVRSCQPSSREVTSILSERVGQLRRYYGIAKKRCSGLKSCTPWFPNQAVRSADHTRASNQRKLQIDCGCLGIPRGLHGWIVYLFRPTSPSLESELITCPERGGRR